jgi:hypothetical protein
VKSHLLRSLGLAALVWSFSGACEASSGAVRIRYNLSLAGLPIGIAFLNATIRDDAYKVNASAKIGGILSLISDGKGVATASGRIAPAKPVADDYALNTLSSDKQQTVRMALSGGHIDSVEVRPAVIYRADRVPVSESHKQGVMDPLSALLMPVPGTSAMVSAAACERTLPVFDGAQRFDVTLAFSRMETVTSEQGYSGPTVVCSARYRPISGHRAKRDQTRFMAANRDLEVWLAPIVGTRVLAPWRIVVGTQIGRLEIAATRFSDSRTGIAAPTPASAN